MGKQFLTAVFELRPSRRKAAAMERVRSAAEGIFWEAVAAEKDRADAIALIEDKNLRREAWREAQRQIYRSVRATAAKRVCSSVADGIVRDVTQAVSSYIELRAGGQDAQWPTPMTPTEADHAAALDLFLSAGTKEHEDAARDAAAKIARMPGPRPFVMSRSEDANLIRLGPSGSISVVLNICRASDPRARRATIKAGIEAASGEILKAGASHAKLVVPLSCSKWHEQKFLSGKATLRSSLIVRRDERWFMCAQFEMAQAKTQTLTGARIGVDRGIANPIALAVVDRKGAVISTSEPLGSEIGEIIASADKKRRAEQKRRGITSRKHVRRVDDALHHLANRIVAEAKAFGAVPVFEKLDGLKQTIVTKRAKGSRKGGWRKAMKKAQLGKLEQIVAYKLNLAGVPSAREVVAGGTSISCPACATRDPKSRPEQAVFACVACGFTAHADTVAAVNVGRRDIAMKMVKKGDKLEPHERDMVARLRLRGDNGLGPLAGAFDAANGFVLVRAAAASANEGLRSPPTDAAGQKVSFADQNPNSRVFAERVGAYGGTHAKKVLSGQRLAGDRAR
jgi:IS605 OrfB family transposase